MIRGGNPQTLDRCTTDGRHSHVGNVSVLKSLQYLRITFWGFIHGRCGIRDHQIHQRGYSDLSGVCRLLPFLLSSIGLTISVPVLPFSDAKHCNRSRKRLHPLPQTFATFASNVCNLCLKRLHPLPQTFASTCKRPRKALPLSPQAFASSGIRDTPHLISFIPYPCADMPPFSVRMTAKSLSYASESSFGYGLFCRMLLFTYYI